MRLIYPPDSTARRGLPDDARLPPAAAALAALARLYGYPEPTGPGGRVVWVRANMIASVDGAATLAGRSGTLSGPADRLVFSVLRSLADVILVGAGTARAERYRPVTEAEVWPELRAGRAATPPIAVVTRALDLDPDGPLLAQAPRYARTIVLATQAAPTARLAAAARGADVVLAGRDTVTAGAAIDILAARGHRRILTEGGPLLLGQLTAAGLLDELCLTYSALLAGPGPGRIVTRPPSGDDAGTSPLAALSLAHVIEDGGQLLCRYLRVAS